jgi:iron(III) transport system substrate-binding protein
MLGRNWSRREALAAAAGSVAGAVFAEPTRAAAPPPATVTPALIEAARKEGKISYYAAIELGVAERLGKMFEAKYPGIAVRVERSGASRCWSTNSPIAHFTPSSSREPD